MVGEKFLLQLIFQKRKQKTLGIGFQIVNKKNKGFLCGVKEFKPAPSKHTTDRSIMTNIHRYKGGK